MKIQKELLEDHQIQLNVEIDAEPYEKAKHQAARKIAKKVKIPGFRPGKAPYNVILRHVGEGAIVEDAVDILVEDIYPKIIDEAEIQPYGPGSLKNIESLEPPTFEFVIPLAPEVELGDYNALDIPYEVPEVDEEAVTSQIEELRQQQAITEKSENPAKEGDRVFYRVSADRAEVVEGQEANIIPERFNSTIIEVKDEEQNLWPYLGFSRNLIGMSIDDEKDIVYTYPEDHEDEELQGVEAVFHVVVTNVQSVSLPELDDEFAKSASDFDTIDELRSSFKENLIEQNQKEYDSTYNDKVLETLVEQSTVKYPPQMLENEKKEIISNLEYRLSQQGITRELYLQIRGISEDQFQDEITPIAEERIKNGLVLAEVAKIEKLEVNQEQLASETGRTMDIITRGMTPKDAKEFQQSSNIWNLMNSIMADMMTQQSMQYIRAIAKGDPLPGAESDDSESGGDKSDTQDSDTADVEDVLEDSTDDLENVLTEDSKDSEKQEVDALTEADQTDHEEKVDSSTGADDLESE